MYRDAAAAALAMLLAGSCALAEPTATAPEPDHAHFITSTVVQWLPVFTTRACCDILANSLDFCRAHKGLPIHGWVILDNHFHAILSGPELAQTIADLKKFTARQILEELPRESREWLRGQLAYFREAQDQERAPSLAGRVPSPSHAG